MSVRIDDSLEEIDWAAVRADLIADDLDNGRSPHALSRWLENDANR